MEQQKKMCCLCLNVLNSSFINLFSADKNSFESPSHFDKISSSLPQLATVLNTLGCSDYKMCGKCCDTIEMIYTFNQTCLHNVRVFSIQNEFFKSKEQYNNLEQGESSSKESNTIVEVEIKNEIEDESCLMDITKVDIEIDENPNQSNFLQEDLENPEQNINLKKDVSFDVKEENNLDPLDGAHASNSVGGNEDEQISNSKKKEFTCSVCNVTLCAGYVLNRHMRIHSGVKPYIKMPRSKTGKTRNPIDPESMKRAIEAVTASPDRRISIREACRVFSVKFATLVRHINAFKASGEENFEYKVKYDVKKVFSEEEELKLVDYIMTVAKLNYGMTKKGVRALGFQFAVANNKKYPPNWNEHKLAGEEWMRLFIKRHSEIRAFRKPEKTSLCRATSFNQTNVCTFFNNLEEVHSRFGPFPPGKIWNQDETAITTVENPSKIAALKGTKKISRMTSAEHGPVITISACVSAVGNYIPPMMIFPYKTFEESMLKGAPAGTIGEASPSGWLNDVLYRKFMEHFIKYTKPTKEERVLLIIDNDESHLSLETLDLASKAGVVILTFPPHTSHKLQPLDLTVFSPFKAYYNQGVEEWFTTNPEKTFDIYSIAEIVGQALPRAFSTNNISSGFKKSGICPLDRGVFSENDFLPEYVTDHPVTDHSITDHPVTDHPAEVQSTSSVKVLF